MNPYIFTKVCDKFVTKCVNKFVTECVTKFVTKFITSFITKFCDSLNSSPILSPHLSPNWSPKLVSHQIRHQICHQICYQIPWGPYMCYVALLRLRKQVGCMKFPVHSGEHSFFAMKKFFNSSSTFSLSQTEHSRIQFTRGILE